MRSGAKLGMGQKQVACREFRGVVFEDVGLEHDSVLTLNIGRCGDFTAKADMGEGFEHSMLKLHIPKHHIPEHPSMHGSSWDAKTVKCKSSSTL